jgi:O-methyltransferase involved in polyketide biosynthesis
MDLRHDWPTALWYGGDRDDVADYLDTHGWRVAVSSAAELFAAYGLPIQTNGEEAARYASLGYVTATRT